MRAPIIAQYYLLVFVIATCLVAPDAAAITIAPVEDTYITEHAGLGGPNSTHGADTKVYCITGVIADHFQSRPLIKFNLEAYAGRTVAGDGVLELLMTNFNGSAPPGSSNIVSVQRIDSPDWDASTVTWANHSSPSITQLSTTTVTTFEVGSTIAWTIPASTLQSWIDNPTANFGLALVSLTGINGRDALFSSLEGSQAPSLTFSLLPGPDPPALPTLSWQGIAMLFAAVALWRCLRFLRRAQ